MKYGGIKGEMNEFNGLSEGLDPGSLRSFLG